jgi:tetratricopeptide (TPR) repeat protein
LDQLWDYDDPSASEWRFRDLLPRMPAGTPAYLELLTQIARAQGLQRDFDAAHLTLDTVERALAAGGERVHIRYLLERGRAFNSSKQPERARPLFLAAWERAQAAGEDFYAIDAAHMLAIVVPPEQSHAWNLQALELAELTPDQRAKKWLGSLCNNMGWAYHDAGQYDQALARFEQALTYREAQGQEREARIARWSVARTLRSLGRTEEALAMQQALIEANERAGADDGYVFEELGECLLALGHPAEAQPYFARAYAELSRDPWLAEGEPERLARLKALGMESILRPGQVVPTFTLPDTAGAPVRRTAYRDKQNLVLVFLPSAEDDGARAYLRALAEGYAAFRAETGEALAIVRGDGAAIAAAQRELALPFPLLHDADGAATARFLPPTAHAGVFVTDRYGELYFAAPAADTASLPPTAEIQAWLEAIDRQCAI